MHRMRLSCYTWLLSVRFTPLAKQKTSIALRIPFVAHYSEATAESRLQCLTISGLQFLCTTPLPLILFPLVDGLGHVNAFYSLRGLRLTTE
jgi:hypothetical protein